MIACGASAPAATAPSNASTAQEVAADAAGEAGPPGDGSVLAVLPLPATELGDAAPSPANVSSAPADASAPSVGGARSACNDQAPQDFLVRGNFLKAGRAGLERAIQYRTDHYGYFPGFGRPGPGSRPPNAYATTTTFMGLPVRMHRKVVPALQCVEQEIRTTCVDHPYTPSALAGIRFRNTYRGGEVTNHAYGIAIDIDPSQNTCCGCVPPWNDAPACKRRAKSEYDRMAMPECWVHVFERFGFYWLGHDTLRDTMHFEFLGDPDRILREQPAGTPDLRERPAGTIDAGSVGVEAAGEKAQ